MKCCEAAHFSTLKSPCSRTAMPYSTIVSLNPVFHQVCSSDLVSDAWIQRTGILRPDGSTVTGGWVNEASRYFQYLATLCELASRQVNESVQSFLTNTMASVDVLSKVEFEAHRWIPLWRNWSNRSSFAFDCSWTPVRVWCTSINPWGQLDTISNDVQRPLHTPSGMINRPAPEVSVSIRYLRDRFSAWFYFSTSSCRGELWHIWAQLKEYCHCALNASCQSSIPFFVYQIQTSMIWTGEPRDTELEDYIAPGLVRGCYMIDTLRLSTLQCFYDTASCFANLLKAINRSVTFLHGSMAGVNVQPLVHDDMLTQFPPTAPISAIIDSMMIERWNISSSFDQYYNTCQPSYCTYMYTLRDPSILSVTTSLISLVGGLSATLRFIVPLIINLFLRSRDRKKKSLQSSNFCSYSEALTNRLSLFFPHSSCAMVSSTARFRKTFSESRSYKTICFEHLSSSPLSPWSQTKHPDNTRPVEHSIAFLSSHLHVRHPRFSSGHSARTSHQDICKTHLRSLQWTCWWAWR